MKRREPCAGDELDRFAEEVETLMPRLLRGMLREERNYLSRGLITVPQLLSLEYLNDRGPATMRELGHACGLTGPGVTALVDRLVKLGLVARAPGRKDRRTVVADLTVKGRRVMAHYFRERQRKTRRTFADIPARERAVYLSVLHRIADRFGDPAEGKR